MVRKAAYALAAVTVIGASLTIGIGSSNASTTSGSAATQTRMTAVEQAGSEASPATVAVDSQAAKNGKTVSKVCKNIAKKCVKLARVIRNNFNNVAAVRINHQHHHHQPVIDKTHISRPELNACSTGFHEPSLRESCEFLDEEDRGEFSRS